MMWSDSEGALRHAREQLAERFPGERVEIIETFDIAYVGWECDYQGALITHSGALEIVICDRVGGDHRPDLEQVKDQLSAYEQLLADTRSVLEKYRAMGGLEGDALAEAYQRQGDRS